MSHVAHVNESCRTCHVAHVNESCRTGVWVCAYVYECVLGECVNVSVDECACMCRCVVMSMSVRVCVRVYRCVCVRGGAWV